MEYIIPQELLLQRHIKLYQKFKESRKIEMTSEFSRIITDYGGICYGTGITEIHSIGIKRNYQDLKCLLQMFHNKTNTIARKNYYLPRIIDLCFQNNCRMFDTSRAYRGSEYTLGQTLQKYPRDKYYIITKLCNADQFNHNVRGGFEKSLLELDVDYIDLYLMHWPVEGHFIESWKEMEQIYKEGKCRAIGVCNFNIHHLEELKKYADIMPMVNEVECHPLFTQNELRDYCNQNSIQILAYTSTARGDERLKKTCLVPIAKKYGKTITQIILRWHQQIGNIPIVNSTNRNHMLDNINIKDLNLTEDEIEQITSININSRLRYDPDNCDFTQL